MQTTRITTYPSILQTYYSYALTFTTSLPELFPLDYSLPDHTSSYVTLPYLVQILPLNTRGSGYAPKRHFILNLR